MGYKTITPENEKAILDDFEKDEFISVDNLDEEMLLAKQAASNYIARKTS